MLFIVNELVGMCVGSIPVRETISVVESDKRIPVSLKADILFLCEAAIFFLFI